MKKKFMKVALLGVLTLTAGASFVGCKDYDDDISGLNEGLAATKSDLASKADALQKSIASLEAAKVDVAAVLAAAKTESDKAALKAKEDAIASSLASMKAIETDLKAKIAANTSDIADLNAYVLEADKKFATLSGDVAAIQKMLLGSEGLVAAVGNLQSANSTLDGRITTLSTEMKASIKDLQSQITTVKTQIGALDELGEGETVIGELKKLSDELKTQKEALDKAATKEELKAANELILENKKSIKDLSDKIASDMNVLKSYFRSMITGLSIIENADASIDKAISLGVVTTLAKVEFGKGLTGAITYAKDDVNFLEDNFLVQVTPSTADFPTDAITIIRSDGKSLMDFVTIGATAYEGVLTGTRAASANGLWKVSVKLKAGYKAADFDAIAKSGGNNSLFAIAVSDVENENTRTLASAYDLTFAAASSTVTSFTATDLRINGAVSSTTVQPVEINKPFAIKLTTVNAKTPVYGSYITLDPAATTAEKALWATFGIEGMNTVTTTNECTINVKSAVANGQEVRFQIHAIDFGGNSGDVKPSNLFTVACGKQVEGTAELKATLLPEAKVATTYDMATPVALTGSLIGTDAWAETLVVTANCTAEFNDADGNTLFSPTAKFYKADGKTEVSVFTNKADNKLINKVSLAGIDLTKITDGGQVEGSLVFKNAAGNVISKVAVTLSKTLPTFPATFSAKEGALDNNGVLTIYPDYSTVNATVAYNFSGAFKGSLGTGDCVFAENAAKATAGVTYPGGNSISVTKAMVGADKKIATKVTYDYLAVSSATPATYVKTWATPFSCEFRSIPKDAAMTLADKVVLKVNGQANATLVKDIDKEIVYADIVTKKQISLDGTTDLTKVKLSTRKIGGKDVDTYFTAAPAKVGETGKETDGINLTAVSGLTLPVGANAFELVFTITDKFGNEFERSVPFTVNM